jgi:hypothetical protein
MIPFHNLLEVLLSKSQKIPTGCKDAEKKKGLPNIGKSGDSSKNHK